MDTIVSYQVTIEIILQNVLLSKSNLPLYRVSGFINGRILAGNIPRRWKSFLHYSECVWYRCGAFFILVTKVDFEESYYILENEAPAPPSISE